MATDTLEGAQVKLLRACAPHGENFLWALRTDYMQIRYPTQAA